MIAQKVAGDAHYARNLKNNNIALLNKQILLSAARHGVRRKTHPACCRPDPELLRKVSAGCILYDRRRSAADCKTVNICSNLDKILKIAYMLHKYKLCIIIVL